MNYIVATILALGMFWGGYFYWDSDPKVIDRTVTEQVPVKNCFVSADGDYLICRINTGG